MAVGKPVSAMVVEEALSSGDSRFLELLRACQDYKGLLRIVQKWQKDHRPWAREQIFAYLDMPMDAAGHQVVVKRLFKYAEAQRDSELMGAFVAAFDRLVRRRRVRRYVYNRVTLHYGNQQVLRVKSNQLTAKPKWWHDVHWDEHVKRKGLRLFSTRTRLYLRRRAWRYFRRMGFQKPSEYPAAASYALRSYRDDDLSSGESILDSWTLMHACFGRSDAVSFTASHANLTQVKRLDEMLAPYFEELWAKSESAVVLLSLVTDARSRTVRVWAIQMLRKHHAQGLAAISVEAILKLLDHTDPEVQQLGAELLENAPNLDKLPLETWLKLLETRNATALASIAEAMRKNVRADRLTLEQMVKLASAKPVPVARLGLEFLRKRSIAKGEMEVIARLANAKSESLGVEVAAYALSILGTREAYDVELVSRFFDSLTATIREGAWTWLTDQSAGWNDPALWSRLLETPYEDVRLKMIAILESRRPTPGRIAVDASAADAPPRLRGLPGIDAAMLAPIWSAVLLGIHRGGRAKLTALRQISDAVKAHPQHAELLLPVLAVAIRSVRLPEARGGLAAVVGAIERRPEIQSVVRKHLPELVLEGAGA